MNRFQLITGLVLIMVITSCRLGERKEKQSKDGIEQSKVTLADVESGIRLHIDEQTRKGNGRFHFETDSTKHELRLVRVHTEFLSVLGPHRFFACVDLADTTGDVYDVDFFLEGEPGNMSVTKTSLHKLNGKPYYTWKQQPDKTWTTVPVKDASNELLGVIEEEDHFEFRYKATIPELSGPAKMWLPIATTDRFQTVKIKTVNAPVITQKLADKENENTIMYLELSPQNSGQIVEIVYDVTRKEKGPYEEPDTDPEKYLASENLLPVGGRFGSIASEAISSREADSKLMQARALYDYVVDDMRYAKQGLYGTGDADYACDSKSGNCTEFHSYFISLARSAGIPARFAIGAAIPSSRNEGGVNGYHCWAEFYADGKWWPVDISEGNKYTALSTYYFGHHPANRIELSHGRNLQVEPSPQSGPIKFLAYPVLEVDGEQVPVQTEFTFERKGNIEDKMM